MDRWQATYHICITVNKKRCTSFGILYLTEKNYNSGQGFFLGRLFATSGVFYLNTDSSDITGCIRKHNRLSKDKITLNYLKSLDLQCYKYVTSVFSEIPYNNTINKDEGDICVSGTLENQLLSLNYLKSLDLQCSKCVTNVLSEIPYYTNVNKDEGDISDSGNLENQFLSFMISIVVDYQ